MKYLIYTHLTPVCNPKGCQSGLDGWILKQTAVFLVYILLLASVSFFRVPSSFAVGPTLSEEQLNPKVRAYEQASSSGDSTGQKATESAKTVFPVKTLKKLTDRLHASVFRIESIQSRIITRVTKMQTSGAKVSKINTKLATFAKQFKVLQKEMETTDKLAATLISSNDKTENYAAFRSEVVVLRGLLNDSLAAQKTVIADMKALEPAKVTPIVTKKVIKN